MMKQADMPSCLGGGGEYDKRGIGLTTIHLFHG